MTDKSPEPIVLRREDFNTTIPLIALTVPTKLCSQYLDKFGKYLLNRPRVKRIYDAIPPSSGVKLLLLGEKIKSLTPSENIEESLPADLVQFHENHCQEHQVPAPYYVTYPFQLTYDHYSADEVLSRYLSPITTEIPSSFETIGHIAHMNLRDDIVGYKHLIGQVILDKNPILKIVVNKIGNIETKFRTFPLEIIAKREDKEEEESTAGGKGKKGGKASTSKKGNAPIDEDEENNDFVVQIKESNAIFHFNFAEVYWNSRLQYEHQRIIDIIRQTATETSPRIVADMMAGVGPFAVPLAMTIINQTTPASTDKNRKNKKISPVTVYANDLNPVSYKYLVKNRDVNRCNHTLHPFNLDGRDFMLQLVQQQKIYPHEVVMNLPAIATEFLDVFIGLYAQSPNPSPMPRIHVYAFSTDESNPINDILHRAAGVLQCAPELLSAGPDYAGHVVRDVAPKKVMVCLSFTLPVEVATRQVSKDVMEISEDNVEEHQKVARKRTREEGENNDEENDRSMEKKER